LTQVYSVEPVKAAWSGWTRTILGQDTISQTITCNWDHLDGATGGYVELFAGDHGAGGAYNLEIKDVTAGQVVAKEENRTPGGSHTWLKFSNIQMEPGRSFTKGKLYEFKFTRSGSDSIQYYYSQDNPYPYGSIVNPSGLGSFDLALRAYGVMDTIGADWFGVNPFFPFEVPSFV